MNEKTLDALEKQVRANALGLVVLAIDLYLYKGQIAQRRWGTPGGNDVALKHYAHIQEMLARTDWPPALAGEVHDLQERLSRYSELIKAMDITRVSFETTRLAEDFAVLQEALLDWAAS